MMWGDGWGGWFAGILMMLVFWGGLVAVVVLLVRTWDGGRRGPHVSDKPGAIEILRERFAKGEISEEEFEQRRRVLEDTTH